MTFAVDALYLLFLGEAVAVFFVAMIFFIARSRRHRRLYRETLKELNALRSSHEEAPAGAQTVPVEEVLETPPAEPEDAQQISVEDLPGTAETEPSEMQQGTADENMSNEPGLKEAGALTEDRVVRLTQLVSLQKKMIEELMGFRAVFDKSQERLAALQEAGGEVQQKSVGLVQSGADLGDFLPSIIALESSMGDLSELFSALGKEKEAFAERFSIWEKDLKEVSEKVGGIGEHVDIRGSREDESGGDDERYQRLLMEREDLESQLRETEKALGAKEAQFRELQKQHEDLEAEYLILYRQQQQQQPEI